MLEVVEKEVVVAVRGGGGRLFCYWCGQLGTCSSRCGEVGGRIRAEQDQRRGRPLTSSYARREVVDVSTRRRRWQRRRWWWWCK